MAFRLQILMRANLFWEIGKSVKAEWLEKSCSLTSDDAAKEIKRCNKVDFKAEKTVPSWTCIGMDQLLKFLSYAF